MIPTDTDDELDIDESDAEVAPEEGGLQLTEDAEPVAATVPELDPEVEAEIQKALVPDELEEGEEVPKAKTHQIPVSLIEKELEWEDLLDSGSI